jgi:L-serine/L-threonine ammonia-lyase
LSLASGRAVWLKLESLQPSGSFKLRGIGLASETYHSRDARRFVCSSSGNAGLAVAYAGRALGVQVTVVVPETATEWAKELLRSEGAEVVVHGASWQEANELALSQVGASDAFLHPFDDRFVWEGHATLVDEVARSGKTPDAVLLSVGGGGLMCGVALGMERNGWGNVPILAVETEGAASFHEATKAGHPVEIPAITSIASSLGAKRVCDKAVEWWRERPIQSLLVSDRSALSACERFLTDQRILIEPSCGASLAPVYEKAPELEPFGTVLVVVCGGATSTIDQIRMWLREVG